MSKQFNDSNSGFPGYAMFWCLGFIYAAFMALMFQKLILPMLPDIYAGHGLLKNDAVVFHDLACKASELIREKGWSQWRLAPGGFGNVGILSAVYAIFGCDPAYFIPLTAAAHATGGLMIYLLGQRLWEGRIGRLGGLIAGTLFVAFPSALQWYGQNHKDAFAIAGILMMLYAWLSVFDRDFTGSHLRMILLMFGGAVLLGVVRQYFPILVMLAFLVSLAAPVGGMIVDHSFTKSRRSLVTACCMLVLLAAVSSVGTHNSKTYKAYTAETNKTYAIDKIQGAEYGKDLNVDWTRSPLLPQSIDHAFEDLARVRSHFTGFNMSIGAGSMIDVDTVPKDAGQLLAYLPRALFVGLFAPFPDTWTERVSAPRLVGAVETLIWYVVTAGGLVLLVRRPSRQLFAGLLFAFCLITVVSFAHPNVGTLYRQRFSFWLFLLLCGAVGWSRVLLTRVLVHPEDQRSSPDVESSGLPDAGPANQREALAASGTVVLLITVCCYIGFMARDLILVRIYGMNAHLDAFFSAAMIPTFLVTFLAMPLSDALTTPFLSEMAAGDPLRTNRFVGKVISFAAAIFGTFTVIVILLADRLMPLIIGKSSAAAMHEGAIILRIYAPLVLLAVWTTLGNCILNALHHARQAALAQMIVPVATIVAILVAPAEKILYAAALGMLAGTFFNAVVVVWMTGRLGYTLRLQRTEPTPAFGEVLQSYRWLATAAFFTVVATPVNYFFAGTVERGAIAAWALASKMVTLFNGLAGVGITAVVLPHLARLATRGRTREIKSDVFFLLIAGTWVGLLLALVVFVFSEPLIYTLLHGGNVADAKIKELADVVKLGCLQLPMVVAYAVIVKVAVVSKRSGKVVLSALASIMINIGCNLALVPGFGVLGLALSSVAASGVSSAFLLMSTRRESHLNITEVMVLILSWIILAFIGVSFHFGSWGTVGSAVFGLAGLAGAMIWAWRIRRNDAMA